MIVYMNDIDYHISWDKVVRLLGIDIDNHISCDKVVRILGIDID
jgi:glutamate/tyrosine decarboxylase-like PLP-dependent enzyme